MDARAAAAAAAEAAQAASSRGPPPLPPPAYSPTEELSPMSTTGSVASAGLSPEQYEAQYYRNQLQEVEAQIAALHKNVFTNCDEELRVLLY